MLLNSFHEDLEGQVISPGKFLHVELPDELVPLKETKDAAAGLSDCRAELSSWIFSKSNSVEFPQVVGVAETIATGNAAKVRNEDHDILSRANRTNKSMRME